MTTEPSHIAHDPYKIEEPALPPVINRVATKETENTFLVSLSKAYRVETKDIKVEIDGHWKIFSINGKTIFRDHA